jgi:acyl carrier protein
VTRVRAIVLSELERVHPAAPTPEGGFEDQQRLAEDLGMSSVEVVELVAAIAERIDPARADSQLSHDVRTVGDLCRVFESFLPGGISRTTSSEPLDPMIAAEERARRRLGLQRSRARTAPGRSTG